MTDKNPFPHDRWITGALCYVLNGDSVLLLRRNRPPHQGKWTAPGGKMELGESVDECIRREIQEETGLLIESPRLHGVANVIDQQYPIYWLLFIYSARQFSGQLHPPDTEEGELAWIKLDALESAPMPLADSRYLPYVLAERPGFFRAKFVYDGPHQLLSESFVFE
jgi:8-oxo-dGTP diphosphatase